MYHQNCCACVWKIKMVLQEPFDCKMKTSNYHKRASRNRIKPTGRGLNETRKWERRLQTRTHAHTNTHFFFLHVGISWWYAAVHTHKLFIFLTLLGRDNIHPQLNLRVCCIEGFPIKSHNSYLDQDSPFISYFQLGCVWKEQKTKYIILHHFDIVVCVWEKEREREIM